MNQDNENKSLLIIVNVDWFFVSHRLPIALEAKKRGWHVAVACGNTGKSQEIIKHGIDYYELPFSRSGTNVFNELKGIGKLYNLYRKIRPDVVHHVTLKPVIYGSIVSRMAKIKGVVNAISGMGYNFTGSRVGKLQKLMIKLMKLGFDRDNLGIIFQNNDDLNQIDSLGIIGKTNKTFLIKGSGVDLGKFQYTQPKKRDRIRVLLPARMLYDKGIHELKRASELLREEFESKVVFLLAGLADTENKAGIPEQVLKDWTVDGYFEWIGYQTDMIALYQSIDFVVLPSYREGLPKSLIEAGAIGLPIVTTNAIGCKECVDDGVNGFKVPVKSVHELAGAIRKLIVSESIRVKMGTASRKKVEREFSLEYVVREHMNIYEELNGN